MKKKALSVLLVIVVLVVGIFSLCACNKEEIAVSDGGYIKDVESIATAPKGVASLLDSDDNALIAKALDDSLSEEEKAEATKQAVALLYEKANNSRIDNEGVSLMVQHSLGGSEQGRVYMNGFTLQNGKNWYYQLPAQAAEGDVAGFEFIAKLMAPIAGNLQIAYTTGDDSYEYFYIMGSNTMINCAFNTFPYATYVIPDGNEPTSYDSFEAYQADRNCRESQLELNNIGVIECKELMTNCTIEHKDGYYAVTFEMDCENATQEQLDEFQRFSKLDLDIGTIPLKNTIKNWRAELEVWDTGYVKTFRSYEVWDMIVDILSGYPVSSTPSNEFVYVWNADEILSIVSQDEEARVIINNNILADDETKIQKCIEFYVSKAKNGTVFVMDFFTLILILVACVVAIIIIVSVTLAILFKKGKLPKLAAAVERDKARRKAITEQNKADRERKKELKDEKKEAKNSDNHNAENTNSTSVDD